MQNLGSLACSVWAVGGGGSKMLLHILYSEETCNVDDDYHYSSFLFKKNKEMPPKNGYHMFYRWH